MPQLRVQTPDLSDPATLQTQSVAPDTFTRPRANPGAGSQLQDLASALAGVRPQLSNFLQPAFENYKLNEEVQGQKYIDALKEGSVSMGDYQKAKLGWSPYRIAAAEASLGRDAASDYGLEAHQTLADLANQPNPNPADAHKALDELKKKYLQQGQGSGNIWYKTFDQYAEQHDQSAIGHYESIREQNREKEAVTSAAHDYAVEITALAHSPSPSIFQQWKSGYADPTRLHAPLSGTQQTEAMAEGFRIAASNAAANGRFDTSDQILAMMREAETSPGSKLAETTVGNLAMTSALHDIYREKQSQNETNQDVRRRQVAALDIQAWGYTKSQLALPPEQRSAFMDQKVLDSYAEAGISPQQAQSTYEYFLKPAKVDAKAERVEDVNSVKSQIADLKLAYSENPTEAGLHEFRKSMTQLTSIPESQGAQAKEALVTASAWADKERENYTDSGLLKNDVVRDGLTEIGQYGSRLNSDLSAALKNLNPDDVIKIRGLTQASTDPDGTAHFEATDIIRDAKLEVQQKFHELAASGVDKITLEQKNAIVQSASDHAKARIQELVKSAKEEKTKDNPGNETSTVTPPSYIDSEGVPNLALAQSILSQRNSTDDAYSTVGQKLLGLPTGGLYTLGSALFAGADARSVQQAQVQKAQANEFGLSLAQLRGEAKSDPNALPWTNTLNQDFRDATDRLTKLEAENKDLIASAASGGLPGGGWRQAVGSASPLISQNADRAKLLEWARTKLEWTQLANIRGLTPAELDKVPKGWAVEPGIPFPHFPIFNDVPDMTEDAVGKIQSKYGLTEEQRLAFYATQRGLIDERKRNEFFARIRKAANAQRSEPSSNAGSDLRFHAAGF